MISACSRLLIQVLPTAVKDHLRNRLHPFDRRAVDGTSPNWSSPPPYTKSNRVQSRWNTPPEAIMAEASDRA